MTQDALARSLRTAHALDELRHADHEFAFPRDLVAGRCRLHPALCGRALLTQRDAVVVVRDCQDCGVCAYLCSIVPASIPPTGAFFSPRVQLAPSSPLVQFALSAGSRDQNPKEDLFRSPLSPSVRNFTPKWRVPEPGSNRVVLLPTSPPAADAASVVLQLVISDGESEGRWRRRLPSVQGAVAASCAGLVLAGGASVTLPPACAHGAKRAVVASCAPAPSPVRARVPALTPRALADSTIPSTSCVRVTMHTIVTVQGVVVESATPAPCPDAAAACGSVEAGAPAARPTDAPGGASVASEYDVTDATLAAPVEDRLAGCDAALRSLADLVVAPLLAELRAAAICAHQREEAAALVALADSAPKGVLLHGPPGTGKTAIVRSTVRRACSHGLRVRLYSINGAELLRHQGAGEAEAALRAVFADAEERAARAGAGAASVVFVDEIDALCPKRDGDGGDATTARLVAELLVLLSGALGRGRVVLVAATNRPNAVDEALRRPGRLDREIAMDPPDAAARESILRARLSGLNLTTEARSSLPEVARKCVGFVGADLVALARDAAVAAARRAAAGGSGEGLDPTEALVGAADLEVARAGIVPSALRAHARVVAATTWDDVGGLNDIKRELRQAVEWPLARADECRRLGVRAPRGVLLHGPPGCSKTTLARAAANATHASFFVASGAEIYSAFVGEAEATVRALFRAARAARPAILFFDEIDAIVGSRGLEGGAVGSDGASEVQARVLSTFLNEMDGVELADGLLVVGATNRLDMIDAAMLRPGRFDKLIHIPLPDAEARAAIFKVHTRHIPLTGTIDFAALAAASKGLSGAEIEGCCREAAMEELRADIGATAVRHETLERCVRLRSGVQAEPAQAPFPPAAGAFGEFGSVGGFGAFGVGVPLVFGSQA